MPPAPPPTLLNRFAGFLGLRRSIIGLLSMVVLVGMGEHLAEQFLPLYLVALGGGYLSVGLLNGMDNLLGALYAFPGGYLADRLGTKRALALFNLLAMAGFLIVVLVPHWAAVLLASTLFLSWSAISLPATMGLVATALPASQRTMGVTLHSLIRRVPMALGPLIGGALISACGIETGMRLAFGGALLLALIGAVAQQRLITDARGPADSAAPSLNPLACWRKMSPPLRHLLVADTLIRFCEQIPYAFVVIWAVGTSEQPGPVTPLQFGTLRTLEMVTAVLVYVPVAWMADRLGKRPFVLLTFVFFALFPLALLFAHSYGPLLAAFVLRGLKEFGEPARKALIVDLAPAHHKASIFGFYYLVRDTIVSVAAFGGALLWQLAPEVNLLCAGAFGVIGTVWYASRGRALERRGSV